MTTYFNHNIEGIICPFDFTRTGSIGLNYAGMLAAALGARLTIFYVEPSIWTEELQLYEEQNDNNKGIRRLLKLETETMKERYGIEANYEIDRSTDSIGRAIGSISTDYDLIVMGTNGADNLYQQVFGVNTHRLLGLIRCPVLMIPPGYELRLPKQMVIVFDQETNSDFLLSQMERLSIPLNAYVRSLPVEHNGIAEAEHKIELLGEMLGIREQQQFNWDFEPIYSDDVVSSVDQYIKDSAADILALSYLHRTLFEKLFKKNVVNKIYPIAECPVLVFWH